MQREVDKQDRYDLGVLLVHGIGQQSLGDTLLRFGEPVQLWLRRWLSRRAVGARDETASIADAQFGSAVDATEAPARAELHVELGTEEPARWLLAESWWANTVLPPSYSELTTWALSILPWTLSNHFATRARRVFQDLRAARGLARGIVAVRLGFEVLGFLLAVLLFPVLVTLVALVLIVGLLPIPRVRVFAARLQRILSGTVGDSFVLIASPIQEAALVGKVARDLRWLIRQKCRRIAVVAHSQGAAIAHAALKKLQVAWTMENEPVPKGRLLFVTVGSGLNKLAEIRSIRDTSTPASVWTAPVGLLLLAAALPEVYTSFRGDEGNVFAAFLAIMGLGMFVAGVVAAWRENRPEIKALEFKSGVRWLDFYASADPVPNGRLFDSRADTRRIMDEYRVSNLASPLFDHTVYWRNEDEFVSQLTCALAEHGELPIVDEKSLDRSHLAVAVKRREWRVRWLILARLLLTVLTAGIALRYWDQLQGMTAGPLNALASVIKWIPLAGDLFKPVAEISAAPRFIGAGALAFFGVATYYVIYAVWSWWNRAEAAALFERKSVDPYGNHFLGFFFLLLLSVETLVLAIAGYGAGVAGGLVAAVIAWGAFYFLIAFFWFVGRAIANQFLELMRLVVRHLVRPIQRSLQRGRTRPAPAAEPPPAVDTMRLVDWREDRSSGRRLWVSFFALILLSYPYHTIVAAPIEPATLWVSRWYWSLRLLSVIENYSGLYAITQAQWLLAALVLVAGLNAIQAVGGLRAIGRYFVRVSHAGFVALAHARLQTEPDDASDLLRRAARLQKDDHVQWESILENLRQAEAGTENGKGEITVSDPTGQKFVITSGSEREESCARLLRASARRLCEIVARLPEHDPEAEDLLIRVSRTSPQAALMLAQRVGQRHPEQAVRALEPHANQPRRLLRWRVNRRLAALKAAGPTPS